MHSIQLDTNRCNGCINCLKRCPTRAIRVRDKKAYILSERCIDCGLCIRVCPHKAKKAITDNFSQLKEYKYTIALPPPSIYAQFNNLEDQAILAEALKEIGFDDVFEVARATELIRKARSEYIRKNRDSIVFPIIATNCSVVTKLIKVKYPDLIENLLPMISPMELAGMIAKEKAMKELGLKAEEIACVFLTPCPAKVTEVHSPIALAKSSVDLAIPINEVYSPLLKQMESIRDRGIVSQKEAEYVTNNSIKDKLPGIDPLKYLTADGIENVMMVLEDLESHEYDLEYVELFACNAGCFGGVLQVENPYIARVKDLNRKKPQYNNEDLPNISFDRMLWDMKMEYEPVMELGGTRQENFERYSKLQKLIESLPGLDCGRCGAPSCEAFAEDVVRGNADIKDCLVLFREHMESVFKMMEASFDVKGNEGE